MITETTEHQKYCVTICIKKHSQSNHGIHQISKDAVIFGKVEHRNIIISNK